MPAQGRCLSSVYWINQPRLHPAFLHEFCSILLILSERLNRKKWARVNRIDIKNRVKERKVTRKIEWDIIRDEKTRVTQKPTHMKIYNFFNGHYAATSIIKTTHLTVNHSFI